MLEHFSKEVDYTLNCRHLYKQDTFYSMCTIYVFYSNSGHFLITIKSERFHCIYAYVFQTGEI